MTSKLAMAGNQVKVISQNMAGGTLYLHHLLTSEKPDFIFLQENCTSTADMMLRVHSFGYKCEANIDVLNPHKPGTAVVRRDTLPSPQVQNIVERRLQSITMGSTTWLNLYAPSGSNHKTERDDLFSQELFQALATAGGGATLPWLVGDWNCVVEEGQTTANFREKLSKVLRDLVRAFKYTDGFSHLHPDLQEYTFHRPGVAQSRLDRLYCPPGVEGMLKEISHLRGIYDHSGIVARLEIPVVRSQPPPQATAYWKLNTSVLNDSQFLGQFKRYYHRLKTLHPPPESHDEPETDDPDPTLASPPGEGQENLPDIVDWWEEIQSALVQFLQDYSSNLVRERKSTKSFLFASLKSATRREEWDTVAILKEKLQKLLKYEALGLLIRSRYQQNSEEERASLFHQGREVRMSGKRNLDKLRLRTVTENGQEETCLTSDKDKILEECLQFYDALFNGRHDGHLVDTGRSFQHSNEHLEEFLGGLDKLSEESQEDLVRPLAKEEVKWALQRCKSGKAPGLDGLPSEYYRKTWDVIGEDFFKVLQCTLTRVRLAESWRHGVTRLMAKVEGVPTVVELRPVTLLLCSYKLLTSVLAFRLRKVLPEVIKSSQLAVPGRQIMSGGFNLISAIEYINDRRGRGGYVVSYDDIKAFDRASVEYGDKVMEAMRFPLKFRAWVRMAHEGATTRLLFGTSGLSRIIQVTFSLRQGDGFSMPLYCLQREPLLRRVAAVLSGLRIGSNPVVSYREVDEAFCDDENIVSSDLGDIIKYDQVTQRYEAQSGAMLSRSSKCKILYLGTWRGRQGAPFPWLQVVEELRVFGLILTPDYKETLKRTWEETFRGVQRSIFSWKQRNFDTMVQRVEAARTFALSKLWYVCQVLPLPFTFAKKIESLLSSFIFRGKPERLKLTELCLPPERGGLSLPELRSKADALRLKQLTRMLQHKEGGSYRHMCYWLGQHLQPYLSEMMDLAPVRHGELPPFFQHALDLLKDGFQYFGVEPRELDQITSKVIYQNFTPDLPDAKVTDRYPAINFPAVVWPRLCYTVLEPAARQVVFDLVHGLVRNRKRLHQQGRVEDPWCRVCPAAPATGQRSVHDTTHILTACRLVRQAWQYVRALVHRHQPGGAVLEDKELVNFTFPLEWQDKEVVWILASFFEMVFKECETRGRELTVKGVRGMLKAKLIEVKNRHVGLLLVQL